MAYQTALRCVFYDAIRRTDDVQILEWNKLVQRMSLLVIEKRYLFWVNTAFYYMAELVQGEKEHSDWFPERSEFCYTDR